MTGDDEARSLTPCVVDPGDVRDIELVGVHHGLAAPADDAGVQVGKTDHDDLILRMARKEAKALLAGSAPKAE